MTRQDIEKAILEKYEAGNESYKAEVLARLVTMCGFETLVNVYTALDRLCSCKICRDNKKPREGQDAQT